MPKKNRLATNTSSSLSGGVSTNYGAGVLPDGTKITFLGDVNNGVIDFLNATIQTPLELKGRRITRDSANGSWRFV